MSAKVLSPLGREYNISIAQVKAMCPMIVGGGGVSVSPTPTAATSSILFLWLHFFKKKKERIVLFFSSEQNLAQSMIAEAGILIGYRTRQQQKQSMEAQTNRAVEQAIKRSRGREGEAPEPNAGRRELGLPRKG